MAQPLTLDLTRTYTAAEFEKLPEFDQNYELVEGRPVEKPMPGFEHNWIGDIIRIAFHNFDPKMKTGVMLHETSVKLSESYVPQPDLSFWKKERAPKPNHKGAAPRPDLAIEIWSPSNLEDKYALEAARAKVLRYLIAGVPLVWAINPDKQMVEVYHAGQVEPQVLQLEASLDGEDIIPGFKLPLKELFSYEEEEQPPG